MINILLDGPKPFWINNADIDDLILLIFQNEWFAPDPNALSFGIGSGSYSEACLLFEYDSVEEVGFASSVDTCNRNDGDFSLNRLEKFDSIGVYLVFYVSAN